MLMPDDFKPYSIDDYDKFGMEDYSVILKAFTDVNNKRLQIMRYLAKEAKDEQSAKERVEIANHIGVSVVDTLEHCNALRNIGAIRQIRSERRGDRGPKERIKYYLAIENLIEILALLNAGILGLPKDAAIKIKEVITDIFNQNMNKFIAGIYGGNKFIDMQEQILDAFRNIAHSYNEAQKGIVNWWCEVTQSNIRNYYSYYPWLYQPGFANMTSQAYRSMTDYTISALNVAQNNFDAYIDMSKTYSGLIRDNISEISKMAENSSKVFEPVSVGPMVTSGVKTIPYILPNMENEDDESSLYEWRKLRDDLTEIVLIASKGT